MTKYIIWNNRKYGLMENRWYRTINPRIQLSHDVWNFYNPNNKIIKSDGNVIHHINKNTLDDNIENLLKMTNGEHIKFHRKGKLCYIQNNKGKHYNQNEKNPMFGYLHSKSSRLKMSISNRFNFLLKKLDKMEKLLK